MDEAILSILLAEDSPDDVILLQHAFEMAGVTPPLYSVPASPFKFTWGKGVRVGKPLKEFRGVLAGIPLFQGAGDQIMADSDAGK